MSLDDYLFGEREPDHADEDPEFTAARIRLGLEKRTVVSKKKKKRHRLRQLLTMPDIATRAQYDEAEDQVLDAKQAEHKVGKCCHCRQQIWEDAFGEQWKAEGGSPICKESPFMTHEPRTTQEGDPNV